MSAQFIIYSAFGNGIINIDNIANIWLGNDAREEVRTQIQIELHNVNALEDQNLIPLRTALVEINFGTRENAEHAFSLLLAGDYSGYNKFAYKVLTKPKLIKEAENEIINKEIIFEVNNEIRIVKECGVYTLYGEEGNKYANSQGLKELIMAYDTLKQDYKALKRKTEHCEMCKIRAELEKK